MVLTSSTIGTVETDGTVEMHNILKKKGLIFVLISLITGGVYYESLKIPFVYDDHGYIVNNGFIKDTSNLIKLVDRNEYFSGTRKPRYRPVSALLYFLGYWVGGLNPLGYHIIKLLLHILNGWLLFLFFQGIFKENIKPFCIALLFILAPFQTEAVNCISFNDDMLACLFLLLALIASAKYRPRSKNVFYYLTLISYFLALLSKETALIFIPLLLLKGYCFPDRTNKEDSGIPKGKYFWVGIVSVTALYLVLRFIVFPGGKIISVDHPWIIERIILIARVLIRYIGILILPLKLTIDYSLPLNLLSFQISSLMALAVLSLILLLSLRISLTSKTMLWGIGWLYLSLGPVIHIVAAPRIIAEHYLYIASIGWFCIFIFIIEAIAERIAFRIKIDISRSSGIMLLLILPVLISFALLSWNRNRDWLTENNLWSTALSISPRSITALNNLGRCYADEGDSDRAEEEYSKILTLESSSEKMVVTYINLSGIYQSRGDYQRAIEMADKALKLNSDSVMAHRQKGYIYFVMKEYQKSLEELLKSIQLNPYDYRSYNLLGCLMGELGYLPEAEEYLKISITMNPDYGDGFDNLNIIRDMMRRKSERGNKEE